MAVTVAASSSSAGTRRCDYVAMDETVPAQIADRIRRIAPIDACVLPGSLPVVSFGNLTRASTATLALNPSAVEFLARDGSWLTGERRRLASLTSMGVVRPGDLDDEAVRHVLAESDGYFEGPNWYRKWFHWLESLLLKSEVGSYLNGTACHLDLVQWATRPAQRDVPAPVWRRLVEDDRQFLHWQLQSERLQSVLVNGLRCVNELKEAGIVRDWSERILPIMTKAGPRNLRVFQAHELGIRFVGWNRAVANALSADGRQRLCEWLNATLTSTW